MYGGLFGDLPSAKGGGNNDDDNNNNNKGEPTRATPDSLTIPDSKPKHQPSVLSALGSKGTAMSFMPTALRQRKRPGPVSTLPPSMAKLTCFVKHEPMPSLLERVHDEVTQITMANEDPIASLHTLKLPIPSLEVESEELRELHANVTDPYDPHLPNDLQAYWSRKATEKHRQSLEKEAREALERQQRLRDELERERQDLEKKGDINQIVQHRVQTSMGRGRGRGVLNLPAWVVNKQKEEARLGTGQEDYSLKRTLILSNLTAPGHIDDDLCDEVKEECEEKCGKVEMARVKDANPPTQPDVEVIVRFERVEDAEEAAKLFHGRLFGTRRITAKRLGD